MVVEVRTATQEKSNLMHKQDVILSAVNGRRFELYSPFMFAQYRALHMDFDAKKQQ